ncbi:MAG: adenylate kinase [Planctomycetota bacterium]
MGRARNARAVFLGGPGAGKGTQAKDLACSGAALHISTGDMLREHVKAGTDLGKKARAFMDAGKLVPDDLIVAMVEERIGRPDAMASWILDGFPRTLPQAEALDKILAKHPDRRLTHVIYFRVPDEVLVGRLSGRRTCAKCGAIWHVENKPTAEPGVCDLCKGALTQRSDDRPEAIQERLEEFHRVTAEPLCSYYESQKILREIDANRPPDAIHKELIELMK